MDAIHAPVKRKEKLKISSPTLVSALHFGQKEGGVVRPFGDFSHWIVSKADNPRLVKIGIVMSLVGILMLWAADVFERTLTK